MAEAPAGGEDARRSERRLRGTGSSLTARSASSRWKYPRPEPHRRKRRGAASGPASPHRRTRRASRPCTLPRCAIKEPSTWTPIGATDSAILSLDAGRVRRRRRARGGRGATRPDEARSIDSGTAERPPRRGGDRTSTRRGRHLPARASVSHVLRHGPRSTENISRARPRDRKRWHPGGDAGGKDAGLPAPLNSRRRTRRRRPPPRGRHGRRGSRRGRRSPPPRGGTGRILPRANRRTSSARCSTRGRRRALSVSARCTTWTRTSS